MIATGITNYTPWVLRALDTDRYVSSRVLADKIKELYEQEEFKECQWVSPEQLTRVCTKLFNQGKIDRKPATSSHGHLWRKKA